MACFLTAPHAIFAEGKAQTRGSTRGYDEQPRKREKNGAVRLRRIGFRDCFLVAGKERIPLALIERVEERAEAGAFQPLHDGMRTGERMKIRRPPEVNARRLGAQQAEIPVGGM